MNTAPKAVTIYTDGACLGNPGPGGYGVILIYGEHRKELHSGYRRTTNNRMEIQAAIAGLEALTEPCIVSLYTDSKYVIDAIEKGWAKRWRANGWRKNKKEPAKNPDLWAVLLELCDRHKVTFRWVKGHSGQPENERCDDLARNSARGPDLAIDSGYEG